MKMCAAVLVVKISGAEICEDVGDVHPVDSDELSQLTNSVITLVTGQLWVSPGHRPDTHCSATGAGQTRTRQYNVSQTC